MIKLQNITLKENTLLVTLNNTVSKTTAMGVIKSNETIEAEQRKKRVCIGTVIAGEGILTPKGNINESAQNITISTKDIIIAPKVAIDEFDIPIEDVTEPVYIINTEYLYGFIKH